MSSLLYATLSLTPNFLYKSNFFHWNGGEYTEGSISDSVQFQAFFFLRNELNG
jgi:hypothetical protein